MPIYDFECASCKFTDFDYRSLDTRDELTECPKCKGSMGRIVSKPRQKLQVEETRENHPHSYDYKCGACGNKDFDRRMPENRDDPFECPKCKGNMSYEFTKTIPTVRIKDRKILRLPGKKPILKERTRVLGTQIGIIRPVEIANAVHDLEQKYAKDLHASEVAESKPAKE